MFIVVMLGWGRFKSYGCRLSLAAQKLQRCVKYDNCSGELLIENEVVTYELLTRKEDTISLSSKICAFT